MTLILAVFLAYLFGSIPFGLLIGRWVKKIDIRQHGSGNIGTTNVFRVIGKKWGLVVFFLDAFKGYFGVLISCMISGQFVGSFFSVLYAVAAILGHTFPIWLSFKGGKGIATSLGVFMAVAPLPSFLTLGIWASIFTLTHIVSISSLIAAVFFPIFVLIVCLLAQTSFYLIPISLALCAFIFYTHRENMTRLWRGEEKRLF